MAVLQEHQINKTHQQTFRKMVGSFSNIEESQYSFLPSQCKYIHPVFHISLLEPVKTSKIPNRHQEPPPPIIIEEEGEWEVSQILYSQDQESKIMTIGGMERFQSIPRIIHLGTN
ncbi:hypothetical protein O181_005255 [Austropuccinia psidii MF-1]|uniref:Uncharacterized protein n=1 Tax=Austropuccinia psidii MF-1 TaxID=1389203 RepID=A0A9Q3BIL7_9BASI|nr:hypothetical protein [Austropuccinia psidii MF-1]